MCLHCEGHSELEGWEYMSIRHVDVIISCIIIIQVSKAIPKHLSGLDDCDVGEMSSKWLVTG